MPSNDPRSPYGRITVATRRRFDVRRLTPELVSLTGSDGAPVPVKVWPYIDEPGHDIDLAFQIDSLLIMIIGVVASADVLRRKPLAALRAE